MCRLWFPLQLDSIVHRVHVQFQEFPKVKQKEIHLKCLLVFIQQHKFYHKYMGASRRSIRIDAMVKVFSLREMLDHVHIARNIFLYVCFGLTLSIQICGESVLNVSFQVFLFWFISDVIEYVVFASAYESSDTSRNQKKKQSTFYWLVVKKNALRDAAGLVMHCVSPVLLNMYRKHIRSISCVSHWIP